MVCDAVRRLDQDLFTSLTESLEGIGQLLWNTFARTIAVTAGTVDRKLLMVTERNVRKLLFGSVLTAFAGDQLTAQRFVGVARFMREAVPFLGNAAVCWIVR
jgi:hypothetical protein